MESFFYGDPWNPRRPRYAAPTPDPKPKPKPRVVSIPVHCVDSDATAAPPPPRRVVRQKEAALRIQRVFRGFLVRRDLERVRRIAAEVDEAERRIPADAAAIGADARERVRVGEMLMGLLLRLDSVRGVREYRRKVIRRVIALQEAVDSIPPADSAVETPNSETLEDAMDETPKRSDLHGQEEGSESGDEEDAPNSAPMEAEIARKPPMTPPRKDRIFAASALPSQWREP
ncbi:BAG family molecular chaperone regulator 5, mitochondrial [Ananas comosus]|uniref:BAG family molecular chaperone regulator 5, mitochondrial n=1 Tax=Ananas comosus TaxID=4615 RepID=A0A199UU89_ANACO|nr:BAG family molecular chaperone regulator 5, mitochondrial [Ananas comosus]